MPPARGTAIASTIEADLDHALEAAEDELLAAQASGALEECFGTGTAAVISPVAKLRYEDQVMTVGGAPGPGPPAAAPAEPSLLVSTGTEKAMDSVLPPGMTMPPAATVPTSVTAAPTSSLASKDSSRAGRVPAFRSDRLKGRLTLN